MKTVLVVDDEKIICDLLQTTLSSVGYEVLTAMSGREGLALFLEHRPRITILDLRLPDMDGIAVLKEIRKVDRQAAVMILTAWGSFALEQQAINLGVTDFLNKNASLHFLTASMERALQRPSHAPSTHAPGLEGAATTTREPKSESILIVDDERQIRELLVKYFSKQGYRVRSAANGPEALALIEMETPSLIILDMKMPGMNGDEVLRKLRERKHTCSVIILTGHRDEKMLAKVLNVEPVDIVGKPVDFEHLALVVKVHLCLKRQS